jgi:hypothetical protein
MPPEGPFAARPAVRQALAAIPFPLVDGAAAPLAPSSRAWGPTPLAGQAEEQRPNRGFHRASLLVSEL